MAKKKTVKASKQQNKIVSFKAMPAKQTFKSVTEYRFNLQTLLPSTVEKIDCVIRTDKFKEKFKFNYKSYNGGVKVVAMMDGFKESNVHFQIVATIDSSD
jgi:hypothetical protein